MGCGVWGGEVCFGERPGWGRGGGSRQGKKALFFFSFFTSHDHHGRDEFCKVSVVRLVGPDCLLLRGGEASGGGGDGGCVLRSGEGEGREEEERAFRFFCVCVCVRGEKKRGSGLRGEKERKKREKREKRERKERGKRRHRNKENSTDRRGAMALRAFEFSVI